MAAASASFSLNVTLVHDDDDMWSATCTSCRQMIAFLVPAVDVAPLIVESVAHVCGSAVV